MTCLRAYGLMESEGCWGNRRMFENWRNESFCIFWEFSIIGSLMLLTSGYVGLLYCCLTPTVYAVVYIGIGRSVGVVSGFMN